MQDDQDKPKVNGHANGHDTGSNVRDFPSAKERAKMQKVKEKQNRPPSEPIINLPPATKYLSILILAAFVLVEYVLPDSIAEIAGYGALFTFYAEDIFSYGHLLIISLFTHSLFHGGLVHLGLNTVMLAAFGAGVERAMGSKRFLALFFLSVAAGGLAHLALFWGKPAVLVGASGGISGLFGALLRIMQAQGRMAPGWRGILPVSALWVGISIVFALAMPAPGSGGTAEIGWAAHIGGFVFGVLAFPTILLWGKKPK